MHFIYQQYVDYDSTKTIRKEMIEHSAEEHKKRYILLNEYNSFRTRIERKNLLRQNQYTSVRALKEEMFRYSSLSYSLDELKKQKKETLYRWLKALKYKVVRTTLKKDMLSMVIKSYEEIMN